MKEREPIHYCKCGHAMHKSACSHVEPATGRHVIHVGGDVDAGERVWRQAPEGLVRCACPGGLLGLVTGRKVPLVRKVTP